MSYFEYTQADINVLNARVGELESQVDDLDTDNEGLNDEISDLESEVETLSGEVAERDRLLNDAYTIVQTSIDDLNAIDEVPLNAVISCIEAVVENLRVVLV